MRPGLFAEPGVRLDWDEIVRKPLVAPRLAFSYAPSIARGNTRIAAGAGLYFEHTQPEYLERALTGARTDTYYAADGVTPAGSPLTSTFTYSHALDAPRAINWSVALDQRLPGSIFFTAGYLGKRTTRLFAYANQSGAAATSGNYVLINGREDSSYALTMSARRQFRGNYTLFAAYTRSAAHTNAALDYQPAVGPLGAQQAGPLGWDAPNRFISWGWTPLALPRLRKTFDFVYTVDWRSGFPYTATDVTGLVSGAAGDRRFPDWLEINPGVEWRFHLHGYGLGLRGIIENITGASNPSSVYSIVDSPRFGTFSNFAGRAFTARIRLIEAKKKR